MTTSAETGQPQDPSPLSMSALADLYLRPSRYFANPAWLTKGPEFLAIAWIGGVTYMMNRVDTNIMKADLGSSGSGSALATWLTGSWFRYWFLVLGVGLVSAIFVCYLGGWWYRMRLNWSGATEVQPEHARAVYVYQDLVVSAPIILAAIVQTLVFPNYMEAWRSEEMWSSLLLVFIVWSCITSYKAVNAAFAVTRWKARIWFLILPLVLYVVVLGVVGAFYAMLEN